MSFRKSLNEEVAAALNEQICIESSAGFLYFSMASWASVRGLTGMATLKKKFRFLMWSFNKNFNHFRINDLCEIVPRFEVVHPRVVEETCAWWVPLEEIPANLIYY